MAENIGDGSTGENPAILPHQPDHFAFDEQSEREIAIEVAKYPPGRQASAVIASLYSVQ